MSKKTPEIKEVIVRKLGREKAYGLAYKDDGVIHIHSEIKNPKEELETFIHECLHILNPEHSESKVSAQGKKICNVLWKHGYRKTKV